MNDVAFSPTWWFGLIFFGGLVVLSLLEWRGVVRTPFERVWPATALGIGVVAATWFAVLVLLSVAQLGGVRFSGLPFATPALIVLGISAVTVAGLVLAFMRRPPRWAVPRHLRGAYDGTDGGS